MPISQPELEKTLKEKFPDATIKVKDLAGDNDHYSVEIIDDSFKGKTLIAQHKMVNNALGDIIKTQLHAMQLKTTAPQ